MSTTIRFHLDEHVSNVIATGLRRRGVDVTTSAEAGLLGADDAEQLAFAASQARVLLTHDEDLLALAAQGAEHAGICYCHQGQRSIRQVIEVLHLLHECCRAEEMRNRVEYL